MSDEAVLIPGQVAAQCLLHAPSPRHRGDFLERKLEEASWNERIYASRKATWEVKPAACYCGERFEFEGLAVTIRVDDERISDIGVIPRGCVYTVVCASALSELAKGRTLDSALQLNPEDVAHELGGLPEDHLHCARLVVNTLGEAVSDYYFRMTGSGLPAVALREGRRADDVSP